MKDNERWMDLCEQASKEQDPEKRMALTQEIIRVLDEKEARLKNLQRREAPSE